MPRRKGVNRTYVRKIMKPVNIQKPDNNFITTISSITTCAEPAEQIARKVFFRPSDPSKAQPQIVQDVVVHD